MSDEAKKKTSILQVQTLLPEFIQKIIQRRRTCQASFTIEAALALSLFTFASVVLLIPILSFHYHREISAVLEKQVKEISQFRYISYYLEQDKDLEFSADSINEIENAISSTIVLSELRKEGIGQLRLDTDTENTEEMICYKAEYEFMLPFGILGLDAIPQQVVACRRAWIGADGKRWEDGDGDDLRPDDQIVYTGITSERYHLDPQCTYLRHTLYMCTGAEISEMRTPSGGRYSPCASCKPNTTFPLVYYTDNGRAYHGQADCSAMRSYIQARHLSEVAYMGACSRCGGGI